MKYWTAEEFRQWEKEFDKKWLGKPVAHADRKFNLHDGNKIRTLFYNYGSIGRPNTEPSIEWPIYSGHGYAYEFGPLVGAEVVTIRGDTVAIFSDAMIDGGDTDPGGGPNVWGWEPLPGYAAPEPNEYVAMSDDPSTWGPLFPKDEQGNLLWPGQYGDGVITADLESYFVIDDRYNAEFEYYPFPSDSSRRGLGIQIAARGYQYAAQLAEDILFFQYEVTNVSEKPLKKVIVAMMGDPHIGGPGDFSDDFFGFDRDMNMVYSWDKVGSSNDYGLPWEEIGWLGFMLLETPGNASDGIDNDNDGMIDESRTDGIDNDGDWDATDEEAKMDVREDDIFNGIDDDGDGRIDDVGDLDGLSDDVGRDGIPGTFDEGEGNGVPDPGEPDFDMTDLDESDQLGLTSFAAPVYATVVPADDDVIWELLKPGNFAAFIKQDADNILLFGSGYFPLEPGQMEKFSIAIIMGQNKDDLYQNARMAYFIYKMNFRFTRPPDIPRVWAVPGDGKVTLYWDDTAEKSFDPLFGYDFEGYAIYRSTDKIHWGTPITDNRGIRVYDTPIAKFDKKDGVKGTHPVGINGIHFYLGDDTGLAHTFVDTGLINGVTYYYAVTAYDSGSAVAGIPPFETPKTLGAANVVAVTPNAPVLGYVDPAVQVDHVQGFSTATIDVQIIDHTIIGNNVYEITFDDTTYRNTVFSVRNLTTGEYLIQDSDKLRGEKLLFEGLQLQLDDVDFVRVIDSLTTWKVGQSTWRIEVLLARRGIRLPRDLEIRIFDTYVDTSVIYASQPTKFQVWNANEEKRMKFVFLDKDRDQELSLGDAIIPVTEDNKFTWEIRFKAPPAGTDTIPPSPGDVAQIVFTKPLEHLDVYHLTTVPARIDTAEARKQLDRIAVVPNPYVAASSFEVPPPFVFTAGRGERRVDFIHLPKDCTIRIYTLTGELVKVIEHHSPYYDGTESWNLLSEDNMDIAAGIYIYHVDAPGIGEKIGRLAIIK